MAEFDTAELLQEIRDRGSLPSADIRMTDARLLAAATQELRDVVAPLLVETQTDRGVYLHDVATVAGTAAYRLPSRALGMRFQSVRWKQTGNTGFTRLRHLSSEANGVDDSGVSGTPSGFYVRDNVLYLWPCPNAVGTLRVPYYARPNTLTLASAAGVVTAVGASTLTVSSVPGAFSSGASYDVVRATPGFETLVQRTTATIAGSVLTFSSTLPTDTNAPAAGDYVCLAGYAPVPQCPVEVRGLLAVRAARRALKSVNEGNLAAMLNDDVDDLEGRARALLAPRADAEPQEWGDASRGLLYGIL